MRWSSYPYATVNSVAKSSRINDSIKITRSSTNHNIIEILTGVICSAEENIVSIVYVYGAIRVAYIVDIDQEFTTTRCRVDE